MQAHRAVHIGHAQKLQPFGNDALHFVARLVQIGDGGVGFLGAYIGGGAAVTGFVPIARFSDKVQHVARVHLSERRIARARALPHVEPVGAYAHILRPQADGGDVLLFVGRIGGIFGRLFGRPGGIGRRFFGESGKFFFGIFAREGGKFRDFGKSGGFGDGGRLGLFAVRLRIAGGGKGRCHQKDGKRAGSQTMSFHHKYLPFVFVIAL